MDSSNLKTALGKLNGVKNVIDLAADKGLVEYDPLNISIAAIIKVADDLGYQIVGFMAWGGK